jgi:hypothetical protein
MKREGKTNFVSRFRLAGTWLSLATINAVSLSAPVWGQSAVWLPPGATSGSIYYNGGNVGIGTTAPNERLEVASRIGITDGGGALRKALLLHNPGYAGHNWAEIGAWDYAGTGSPINLILAGPQTGGYVGIGTTAPNESLEVASRIGITDGGGASRKALLLHNPGYAGHNWAEIGAWNYAGAGSAINLILAGPQTGGNVGIGTTNPQHLLPGRRHNRRARGVGDLYGSRLRF